ncbi:MAG: hypothetical protein JWM12_680, partial [Ilumatobacteraceae bacterium]|nr:hypothetical protein [Ilumatobacteraceae bacterium]
MDRALPVRMKGDTVIGFLLYLLVV